MAAFDAMALRPYRPIACTLPLIYTDPTGEPTMSHKGQSISPPTYPHVFIGEILKEIADSDKGGPRKHVAILGGGMAGLVAAY